MVTEAKGKLVQYKIKQKDVAQALGLHTNTLRNKLDGLKPFTVDEALKIQRIFLPDCDINVFSRETKKQSADTLCPTTIII